MGKWEGLGFSEAIILKTMMIFVIALFIISLIFQYLIKSNKIKPGKISRLGCHLGFNKNENRYIQLIKNIE